MSTYTLTIVTPEKTLYKGYITHLKAKNSKGYFGILARHAPFITTLDPCDISIRVSENDTDEKKITINGGCLKFFKNNCLILADTI
ncbi:MAG: F0F1 ATP synthase subunit epsilon [Chitinispirillia bacterium]